MYIHIYTYVCIYRDAPGLRVEVVDKRPCDRPAVDICQGSRLPVEGEGSVVGRWSLFERFEVDEEKRERLRSHRSEGRPDHNLKCPHTLTPSHALTPSHPHTPTPSHPHTLTPSIFETLTPSDHTLKSGRCTRSCASKSLATLHPQPSTLSPQPSTLNPQPSTLNP